MKKNLFTVLLIGSLAYSALGEEVVEPKADSDAPKVELDRGTRLYDAKSVEELFLSYKEENEKKAAKAAETVDYEDMEVVELKSIEVQADKILNQKALMAELDPQPQNRIRRLARVNPDAVYDIQVAARNDENFFSDSADAVDSNTGSAAQLSVSQMAGAVEATFDKLSSLFGGKKKTGDGR